MAFKQAELSQFVNFELFGEHKQGLNVWLEILNCAVVAKAEELYISLFRCTYSDFDLVGLILFNHFGESVAVCGQNYLVSQNLVLAQDNLNIRVLLRHKKLSHVLSDRRAFNCVVFAIEWRAIFSFLKCDL